MYAFIEPGTTIVSDAAPQYAGCEQLGFAAHKAVNHSVRGPGRFVSTEDPGCHTQNIETRHRHLKDTIRYTRSDETLLQYMAEYTYRERRLKGLSPSGRMLDRFLQDVRTVYPGPGREGLRLQTIGLESPPDDGTPYIPITSPPATRHGRGVSHGPRLTSATIADGSRNEAFPNLCIGRHLTAYDCYWTSCCHAHGMGEISPRKNKCLSMHRPRSWGGVMILYCDE